MEQAPDDPLRKAAPDDSLEIDENPIQSVKPLRALTHVRALLLGNSSIVDLSGLEALSTVDGALDILGNEDLTSIAGLSSLSEVGSIHIRINPQLTNLSGLEQITRLLGDLSIDSNSSLSNLDALGSLSELGGNLEIANSAQIKICARSRSSRQFSGATPAKMTHHKSGHRLACFEIVTTH